MFLAAMTLPVFDLDESFSNGYSLCFADTFEVQSYHLAKELPHVVLAGTSISFLDFAGV